MADFNMFRFNFHFNKPLSKRDGKVWWTLHYKNRCLPTQQINCYVKTETKTNKKQPYAVVQGFCEDIVWDNGVANII